MKPGLSEMKNAIVVPHIASASKVMTGNDKSQRPFFCNDDLRLFLVIVQWTREGMATLAALNVLVCNLVTQPRSLLARQHLTQRNH